MADRHAVCLACGVFARELAALARQGRLDCPVVTLESMLHMRPANLERELRQVIADAPEERFLLVYGDCHPRMHEMQSGERVSRVAGINCCDILLGHQAYRKLQKEQAFIFLPEWTLRWREVFARELGFDKQELARSFMKEYRKKLVYVDTGVLPVPDAALREISEFFALPVEVLPITLDNLQQAIQSARQILARQRS